MIGTRPEEKTFTKIRRWAEEDCRIKITDFEDINKICVDVNGHKFEIEKYKEGKTGKWKGRPQGLYMRDMSYNDYEGRFIQQNSQISCIKKMAKYL